MYLQRTTLEHFDHVVKVVDAPVVLQHQGHTSRQRRKHWLLPNSLSWSRDRHLRCDAATGANVPEGEKHDRDPTGAIHDGSPLAPLRDGGGRFPSCSTTPSTNDPDDTATVETPQIQQPGR